MNTDTSSKPIAIGIFGGGTVGGGICEILSKKRHLFKQIIGCDIRIKTICVQDCTKYRDFSVPSGCFITDDRSHILEDSDISIIVEVIGGITVAKKLIFDAMLKGKHIVTANKALIANSLSDIEYHLMTVNRAKSISELVQFKYEAAVCGGIPIINSLKNDYLGDDINMIAGIINGCTNFMLTAMDRDGLSYEESLSKASKLGFAEADPTLDVGGFDARSKLKILMRLAYGCDVHENDIPCHGITALTSVDYDYAKKLGGTIKLLGVSEAVGINKVSGFVSPCYIPNNDSLACVDDGTNAVEVSSLNLSRTTYIGQGAGRYPTANSCVSDILSIAKGERSSSPFNLSSTKKFVQSYKSAFYLRLNYRDELGITRQCGEICEKNKVSIHSILQNPITMKSDAAFAIITEEVYNTNMKMVVAELEGLDWVKGPVFYMPMLRSDWS